IQGYGIFVFANLPEGIYYVVVKQRQSVETWSKYPLYFNNNTINFDLTINTDYPTETISNSVLSILDNSIFADSILTFSNLTFEDGTNVEAFYNQYFPFA